LDLTGMLLALGVSAPALRPLSHRMRRVRHAVLALLLVWTLLPLGLALWDEAAQRRAFPTLFSFDSALVLSRLEGDAPFRRVTRTEFSSQALLQIDFRPGPFSTLKLWHFPRDWRAYERLHIKLYNPSTEPLMLQVRLHDRAHQLDPERYPGRYWERFSLQAGWNELAIPLARVVAAPAARQMALDDMVSIMLYTANLTERRRVYLAELRLVAE
ncbi:MAG: hypothetical protein R6X06_10130, partial [Gammaproteobacteria bacterium]